MLSGRNSLIAIWPVALLEAYQGKWTSEGTRSTALIFHQNGLMILSTSKITRIVLFARMLLEPCEFGGSTFVGGGQYLSDKNGPGEPIL